MFDSASSFDLDSYLARIGYTGERKPALQALQAVAFRHPAAIPFENLDALLRRPIALDPASLQRKLVGERRGGWCFEHNLLLGHALTAMGFAVTGLAARVLWMAPPGPPRPRSHMLLRIDLDQPYLVDVGFGGLTLTGALRFVPDLEQRTPHEPFRVRSGGSADARTTRNPPHTADEFLMEAQIHGEWRPLYSFDAQPQALADYEVSNWYLLHHPASHFLTTLIAARVEADRRYALRNGELSVHHLGGSTERTTLMTAGEIRRALDEIFHVEAPVEADLDATLERLLPAHA